MQPGLLYSLCVYVCVCVCVCVIGTGEVFSSSIFSSTSNFTSSSSPKLVWERNGGRMEAGRWCLFE